MPAASIEDVRLRLDAVCLSIPFVHPVAGTYASTAHIVEHLLASTLATRAEAEGCLVSARIDRHRIALTIEGDDAAVAEGLSAARSLLVTEWFNPGSLASALLEIADERKSTSDLALLRAEAVQCSFFPDAGTSASQLERPVADFIDTRMAFGGTRVLHVGQRRLRGLDGQCARYAGGALRSTATAPALSRSRLRSGGSVMIWRIESSACDAQLVAWARVVTSRCGAGIFLAIKQDHEGLLLELAFSDACQEALDRAIDAFRRPCDRAACSREQEALAVSLARMSPADCARIAMDGWRRTGDSNWISHYRHSIERGSPPSSRDGSARAAFMPWRAIIGADAPTSDHTFASLLLRKFEFDMPTLAVLAGRDRLESSNAPRSERGSMSWPSSSVAAALHTVHAAITLKESVQFRVVQARAGLVIETVSNTVEANALRLIAEALQHRTGLARLEAGTIGPWPPATIGILMGERVIRLSIDHSGGNTLATRLVLKACRALIEDPLQYRRAKRLADCGSHRC